MVDASGEQQEQADKGVASNSPATAASGSETKTDTETGKSPGGAKPQAKAPPLLDNAVAAPPSRPRRWPVFLVFLIALGAAGGAGYTYWQLDLLRKSQQGELRAVSQAATASLADRVSTLDDALRRQQDSARLTSAEQQDAISQLMARVGNANRRIGEITNVSRQSWMLAEAEYLLRLANQRLVVEQAVQSSLALLKAADSILLQVDDVNLFEVRGVLAKEITSLQAIDKLDIEGVFLQLSALADQSAALALLLPREESPAGQDTGEQAGAGEPAQQGAFDTALQGLFELVQIRQRDVPLQPLLTPEQHYYVQQNLRLMLEQTQLALLQRRQPLYQESLASAAQWVGDYFQLNPAAESVIARLEELQQLNVAAPLPDISGSLGLLKGYLSNPDQPVSLPRQEQESGGGQETSEAAAEQLAEDAGSDVGVAQPAAENDS